MCSDTRDWRGQVEQGSGDMKIADLKPIKSLDEHNTYKFLGVFENTKQEDKQVLEAKLNQRFRKHSMSTKMTNR